MYMALQVAQPGGFNVTSTAALQTTIDHLADWDSDSDVELASSDRRRRRQRRRLQQTATTSTAAVADALANMNGVIATAAAAGDVTALYQAGAVSQRTLPAQVGLLLTTHHTKQSQV